jgi:hypothetical protein
MPPLFDVFDKSRMRCDLCRRSARQSTFGSHDDEPVENALPYLLQ